MKKVWVRTSFRLKADSVKRLKNLCERSGYKQKEILDEILNRGLDSNIFSKELAERKDTSKPIEVPEVYKSWVDLSNTQRTTYEVNQSNLEGLDKIVEVHHYLNRDQVLNIIIFRMSEALSFPLKAERKKLLKLTPKIKRLIGLKKMIEKDILKTLGEDTTALSVIQWKQFSESVEHFERAFAVWSTGAIFYSNGEKKVNRRVL